MRRLFFLSALSLGFLLVLAFPGLAREHRKVRFATYNIQELGREKLDQVDAKGHGTNTQLRKAAEIIQRMRPEVLLINEIDYDFETKGQNARLFMERYLAVGQNSQKPLVYDHIVFEPVNTGVQSGIDLNNNGKTGDPEDAFGFGKYPGQYGMALYSLHPITTEKVRTFRNLLWKDVPGNLIPDGMNGRPKWYSPEQIAIFRLSSKSHWDVPITIEGKQVHFLCSHPTPPVFDGPEDRNGRRNHDEVRFWADYLSGGESASYIRDDKGRAGALPGLESFVLMGDLNAEPVRGDLVEGKRVIDLVLKHPRIQDPKPQSEGAAEADGPDLANYKSYRSHGFGRLDYVLPSKDLKVESSGVFWPKKADALWPLIAPPDEASDHRMVWLDILLP